MDYFSRTTAEILRAIAIVCLLAGHIALCCTNGNDILSIRGGEWAVLIFLITSAMGTGKSYGLDGCGKRFLYRRLAKLVFPLWLSLGLFYGLDYAILHKVYPLHHILLSFAGILDKAPPDSPAWFVTFIVYLYLVFFLVSNIPVPRYLKCATFMIASFVPTLLIHKSPLVAQFIVGWQTYTFAYPLSICIIVYRESISRWLQWLIRHSFIALAAAMPVMLFSYFVISYGKTIFFVAFVAILIAFLDKARTTPKVIKFLSNHSYEIYLVHFPFLASYGFLTGRKPFVLYLTLYLALVILLGIILRTLSKQLNRLVFPKAA